VVFVDNLLNRSIDRSLRSNVELNRAQADLVVFGELFRFPEMDGCNFPFDGNLLRVERKTSTSQERRSGPR
jgi:hypothetical protein